MKNILKISLSVFIFLSLVLSTKVFAVDNQKIEPKEMVLLAGVDIHEAQITSQNKNIINISFKLSNGKGIQSGVKYGVQLIKETNKNQFVVDEKIYDDLLTLPENSSTPKEIVYTAPSNISGDYTIFIESKNESGFLLGVAYAGKIKLEAISKGIIINPESCYLSVVDEVGNKKYNLVQGVDIAQTETLKLICQVTNTDTKEIKADPSFVTHYRTLYGEIVSQSEVVNDPTILKAGEKKMISIFLPKATAPQAYDVVTTLTYGDSSSNSINAHYVLRGVSATIQNLSLDKDYYQKGDTAILSFSWSPSADNFPGGRFSQTKTPPIFLYVDIENDSGGNCADPILKDLSKENRIKIDIPVSITKNCTDPKLLLTLKDESGNILDEKTFNLETQPQEKTEKPTSWATIIVLILAIIVAIAIYLKRKKKNKEDNDLPKISTGVFLIIFSIIFISGIFIPISKTNAVMLATPIDDPDGGGGGGGSTPTPTPTPPASGMQISVSLNKADYDPNETLVISATGEYIACTNQTRDLLITGWLHEVPGNVVTIFNNSVSGTAQVSSSNSDLNARPTAGSYHVDIEVKAYRNLTYYSAWESSGSYWIADNVFNINDIRTELVDWVYGFDPANRDAFYNALYATGETDYATIQSVIGDFSYPIILSQRTTNELDFSGTYQLPYNVIQSVSVDVKVYHDGVWTDGPVKKSTGNSAEVSWTTQGNPEGCKCECRDPISDTAIDCGNTGTSNCGTGNAQTNYTSTYPVSQILRPTKFHVCCGPIATNCLIE